MKRDVGFYIGTIVVIAIWGISLMSMIIQSKQEIIQQCTGATR